MFASYHSFIHCVCIVSGLSRLHSDKQGASGGFPSEKKKEEAQRRQPIEAETAATTTGCDLLVCKLHGILASVWLSPSRSSECYWVSSTICSPSGWTRFSLNVLISLISDTDASRLNLSVRVGTPRSAGRESASGVHLNRCPTFLFRI